MLQDPGGEQGGRGQASPGRPIGLTLPGAPSRDQVSGLGGKGDETTVMVDTFRVRLSLLKEIHAKMKPIEVKDMKDCLPSTEKHIKVEDAMKEDCWRQTMDEPMMLKSVTDMLRGTTKAMPKLTPMNSSNRIWHPGRRKDYILFRGVNVGINHG